MQEIKPYLERVKGNTWCIVTAYARIPLYKLDETRAIMIDSGLPSDGEEILEVLEKHQLQVVALLTSHTHPDHVGNHRLLKERYGAKVYMTAFAAATMADPVTMYAVLGTKAGYHKTIQRMNGTLQTDHFLLWEDGKCEVEGAVFRQIATAGHCAEHLCFVTPDNVAYLGDAILSEHITRTVRLPYCNCLEPYIASWEKIGQLKCDKYILAHNGILDEIRELVALSKKELERRLIALEDLARTPVTADELVRSYLVKTDADLTSWRSVNGVNFNAKAFTGYLVDKKRLLFVLEDGIMKFVKNQENDGGNQ